MANKLVIFDLDGVLVETRDLHYETMNAALSKHGYIPIPRNVHLSTYDGLPTTKKLEMLGIPEDERDEIWHAKQRATIKAIAQIPYNVELDTLFSRLCQGGIKIAVASNAISRTTKTILHQLHLDKWVRCVVCADSWRPKPAPDMYWECMAEVGATAQTTVIVEDSHIGRAGAIASGAMLCPVTGPEEVTYERITAYFSGSDIPVKYRDPIMNVVIPMAGDGSRFAAAGYTFPKPLVEVNGKPMIQVVVENLNIDAHYTYIVRQDHRKQYNLDYLLNLLTPGCRIVEVEHKTQGAACTVLLGLADPEGPLLIVNSDQYLEWDSNLTLHAFSGSDGGIVTFESAHPKWSYVKLGDDGFVDQVAEKKVISNQATAGVYYWKRSEDYAQAAWEMMRAHDMVNGEYYVAPVFNYGINRGAKIRAMACQKMYGLGTPEDLRYFLEHGPRHS